MNEIIPIKSGNFKKFIHIKKHTFKTCCGIRFVNIEVFNVSNTFLGQDAVAFSLATKNRREVIICGDCFEKKFILQSIKIT